MAQGFDYDLITEASPVCTVPLIISGGLGKIEHIKKLKKITHVDAIAAGNAFPLVGSALVNTDKFMNIKENINSIFFI